MTRLALRASLVVTLILALIYWYNYHVATSVNNHGTGQHGSKLLDVYAADTHSRHRRRNRTRRVRPTRQPLWKRVTTASPVMRILPRQYFCDQSPTKRIYGMQEPQVWQRINEFMSVFSAYYVTRRMRDGAYSHEVQILAISDRNYESELFCLLWYAAVPWAVSVRAEYSQLGPASSSHAAGSVPRILSCHLPTSVQTVIPLTVSISTTSCQPPNHMLKVVAPAINRRGGGVKLGVCLSPLRAGFDALDSLIEFFEIMKLTGVVRVTVYDDNVSARVTHALETYRKAGLAKVVRWKPTHRNEAVSLNSAMAQKDCLRRNRGVVRFLITSNVNELVIPTVHTTLEMMMRRVLVSGKSEYHFPVYDLLIAPSRSARLMTQSRAWMNVQAPATRPPQPARNGNVRKGTRAKVLSGTKYRAPISRGYLKMYDLQSVDEVDDVISPVEVSADVGRAFRYTVDSQNRRGRRVDFVHQFSTKLSEEFFKRYKQFA